VPAFCHSFKYLHLISQYHQRLFAIDNQVNHLSLKSLRSLGSWLARKWKQCTSKTQDALTVLDNCGHPLEVLEAQWTLQVQAQTSPLAKVSKTSARKAVEQILALVSLQEGYKRELNRVSKELKKLTLTETGNVDDLAALSLDLTSKLSDLASTISHHKRNLGVEGKQNLKALVASTYLQTRLNAAALKERIQSKLRSRKFELERLDKASRNPGSNGMCYFLLGLAMRLTFALQTQSFRHIFKAKFLDTSPTFSNSSSGTTTIARN
jgi:hypothetical protein